MENDGSFSSSGELSRHRPAGMSLAEVTEFLEKLSDAHWLQVLHFIYSPGFTEL